MAELPAKQLGALEAVLGADDDSIFEGALKEFRSALPQQTEKRTAVTNYLLEQLEAPTTPRNRCSYVTLLAEVNTPEAVETVASFLDPDIEPSDRVQYQAAISLWQMNPPELDALLAKWAENGALSSRVRAVLLRALSQHYADNPEAQQGYFDRLMGMAGDGSGDNSWAVLRAFRRRTDAIPPPSAELERRLVFEFVVPRLRDQGEWRDVRIEAAFVLGDVEHEWNEAVQALTSAYGNKDNHPPENLRRTCIEALGRLGKHLKRREVQTAMLLAL